MLELIKGNVLLAVGREEGRVNVRDFVVGVPVYTMVLMIVLAPVVSRASFVGALVMVILTEPLILKTVFVAIDADIRRGKTSTAVIR